MGLPCAVILTTLFSKRAQPNYRRCAALQIAARLLSTSCSVVAHEDTLSWGYGAEIAARISGELFEYLDAPIRRVAAVDTFVAYQPLLEDEILPQADDFYSAMQELAEY